VTSILSDAQKLLGPSARLHLRSRTVRVFSLGEDGGPDVAGFLVICYPPTSEHQQYHYHYHHQYHYIHSIKFITIMFILIIFIRFIIIIILVCYIRAGDATTLFVAVVLGWSSVHVSTYG